MVREERKRERESLTEDAERIVRYEGEVKNCLDFEEYHEKILVF